MKQLNKRAFRRAMWASLSRVIGVVLATGAGTIVRDVAGDNLQKIGVCAFLALTAWAFMLYAEYARESGD